VQILIAMLFDCVSCAVEQRLGLPIIDVWHAHWQRNLRSLVFLLYISGTAGACWFEKVAYDMLKQQLA
jgi:hypothetical protein